MVSLDLLVSFASAARHAGFAGAARSLGLSPSAVAKNVARLEAQLGVRLFHRTTRRVTLSAEGEQCYARCIRVLDELESLEDATAGRDAPRGTLRIDMPVSYGRDVVLPVLARLLARHPALSLEARFSDHVTDLVKEGVDAAVRIGTLADSGLVGRVFDRLPIWTCASPAYLRRHGEPARPEELGAHSCLLFRLPVTGRERPWQFRVGGRAYSPPLDTRVRLGDGEALVQAAMAGLGIAQVPRHMAEREVQRGALVEVLRRYRPAPLPVSLVYPSRRHVPQRVQLLARALAAVSTVP